MSSATSYFLLEGRRTIAVMPDEAQAIIRGEIPPAMADKLSGFGFKVGSVARPYRMEIKVRVAPSFVTRKITEAFCRRRPAYLEPVR